MVYLFLLFDLNAWKKIAYFSLAQFENDVTENTSLIARSFKRLEEGASAASGGRDQEEKAREWLLLQQQWTERMDEDDNYFDDQL